MFRIRVYIIYENKWVSGYDFHSIPQMGDWGHYAYANIF